MLRVAITHPLELFADFATTHLHELFADLESADRQLLLIVARQRMCPVGAGDFRWPSANQRSLWISNADWEHHPWSQPRNRKTPGEIPGQISRDHSYRKKRFALVELCFRLLVQKIDYLAGHSDPLVYNLNKYQCGARCRSTA